MPYAARCKLVPDFCQAEPYMDTLSGLLNAARTKCGADSELAFGKKIGVSRQTLHDWRTGAQRISDEHLAKLIDLADTTPATALLVRAEQAKSAQEKALWSRLARQLGAAAALVLCVVPMLGNAAPLVSQAERFLAMPIM